MHASTAPRTSTPALSRRTFAAAAGAAAMGAALAARPQAFAEESSDADSPASSEADGSAASLINAAPESIAATYGVDVVIVGSGGSGVACLLQAVENGLTAMIVEKQDSVGGGTKGGICAIFSVGDSYHEAAGLNVYTPAELVAHELKNSQYRADGARWLQLANESADDVAWIEEHGGAFWRYDEIDMSVMAHHVINVVSDFSMTPLIFKDCDSLVNCIQPLAAAAQQLGGQILLDTKVTSLIQGEDGAVCGVYAQGPEGGVQVNARAVVLATGGFSANDELLAKAGWNVEETVGCHMGVEDGDGYLLGLAAGAQDRIGEAAPMAQWVIEDFPGRVWNDPVTGDNGFTLMARQVLVNQDAKRFMAEDSPLANPIMQVLPTKNNQRTYAIFTRGIYEEHFADVEDAAEQLEEALAGEHGSIFECDSIEEAAEAFGLDAAQLQATIDHYNECCDAGLDDEFLKGADYLQRLEPPYLVAHVKNGMQVYVGGLNTSSRFEVLDASYQPIPGLYATGVDGCTLYRNCYTVAIGSGTFAHSIWSGRKAADAVAEYVGA